MLLPGPEPASFERGSCSPCWADAADGTTLSPQMLSHVGSGWPMTLPQAWGQARGAAPAYPGGANLGAAGGERPVSVAHEEVDG